MIHHISFPAKNPRHVADVLAQLWEGRAFPFPPASDSYVVFPSNSSQGICIEVYPLGTELIPGAQNEQVQVHRGVAPDQFCEFHAAISVPLCWEQIEAIAKGEGWRAVLCDRGASLDRAQGYQIIEFWIENRFLLELLTPQMLSQYSAFITPENWEQFFELELLFNADSQSFAYKSRLSQSFH